MPKQKSNPFIEHGVLAETEIPSPKKPHRLEDTELFQPSAQPLEVFPNQKVNNVGKDTLPKETIPKISLPLYKDRNSFKFNYPHIRRDHNISRVLARLQTLCEQSIYNLMYDLAYGAGRNICWPSHKSIQEHCNISHVSCIKGIKGLVQKGHIKIIKKANVKRNTTYQVFLPHQIPEILAIIPKDYLPKENLGKEFLAKEINALPKDSIPVSNIYISNIYTSPQVIYNLYNIIGQDKPSKSKIKRGEEVLKNLLKEGYTLEEIDYTIKWIPKNMNPKEIKDFSIIPHIISQALRDRKTEIKKTEKEKKDKEKEKQDQIQLTAQELKQKAITEQINNLPQEERQKLTQKARELTKNQQNLPFYETIVRTKEREIISQEISKTTPLDEEIAQKLGVSLVKLT